MYLVFCMTNYGDGFYIGGVYRSYDRAVKRLEWCEAHSIDPDNDSWHLVKAKSKNITEEF